MESEYGEGVKMKESTVVEATLKEEMRGRG
jgi:hypothetical protein